MVSVLFLMTDELLIIQAMKVRWKKKLRKFSEKDLRGYKNLVNFTEKIFDKGFTELSDKPFNKLSFMIKQIPCFT